MSTIPLVSIVTPSLNQGRFIQATIESVLQQSYPRIEYIVIDGGSTDGTVEILKSYGDEFHWICESDYGQADAINKGMDLATGTIAGWLNSDDILLPGAIDRVIDCFRNNSQLGMIYGKSHFIDETGKVVGRYPTEAFDFRRLAAFNFIPQPSTFFIRDGFLQVGSLNPNLRYAFDLDLWLRLSTKFITNYLPAYLSGFRLHDTSKTVSPSHSLGNQKEGLDIALTYFNWAPLNRVYGYCFHLVRARLPKRIRSYRMFTRAFGLLVTDRKSVV